ncbi:hypothetical protein PQX77_013769 [Marasmius sp. AFHP31]|nr:hypothetical protein PQX77_013769 [Marasmius sp. AFHP31]
MFLFKHLTLPGLENLSVRNDDFVEWNAPWDVEHILSALSLCNLTSLTLTKVPLRDGDFISLLEVMPTLESLSFSEYIPVFKPRKDPNNMTITPYVLARLSLANSDFPLMMPRPDSARLLPHLQHLSLCVYAGGLDQRALGKAVLSRRTGSDSSNDQNIGEVAHQGLRSFEVVVLLPDAKATASLELVSWLECLSDVGLRVRVKTETTKYGLGFALESMVVMSDISDSDEDSGDDSDNE